MGQSWFSNNTTRQNILVNIWNVLQFHEANTESSIVFVYAVLPPNNPTQSWPSAEIKGYSLEGNVYDETLLLLDLPITFRREMKTMELF